MTKIMNEGIDKHRSKHTHAHSHGQVQQNLRVGDDFEKSQLRYVAKYTIMFKISYYSCDILIVIKILLIIWYFSCVCLFPLKCVTSVAFALVVSDIKAQILMFLWNASTNRHVVVTRVFLE